MIFRKSSEVRFTLQTAEKTTMLLRSIVENLNSPQKVIVINVSFLLANLVTLDPYI